MAVSTNVVFNTAGISPIQYGTEVSLVAQSRSVMMERVRRYIFPPGYQLEVPVIAARTVSAAAAQPTTVSFTALSGTGVVLTNSWAYDALEINKQALASMSPERLNMALNAVRESAGQALANQVDTALLGLYAGYTGGTAIAGSGGPTNTLIRLAISELRMGASGATSPLPYYIVLHENEWDALSAIAELDQYTYRGDTPIVTANVATGFSYRGVGIITTNNVPLSTNRRGVAFSGEAFGLAIRNMADINEAFDINTMSQKIVISADFAYKLVQPGYAIEFTGGTS